MPTDRGADDAYEGTVPVRVSAKDVHKAVRNILHNELNVGVMVAEAVDAAKRSVAVQVSDYLRGNGYDQAGLAQRVERYAQHYLKADMQGMVEDALAKKVGEFLSERGLKIVEAVVQEGIKVRLGWTKADTLTIKTELAQREATALGLLEELLSLTQPDGMPDIVADEVREDWQRISVAAAGLRGGTTV